MSHLSRREFLARSTALGGFAVAPTLFAGAAQAKDPPFKISLAQWSLNRAFFGRPGVEKKDPLKFAQIAFDDFRIEAIEYVNQFYKDKKNDDAYLKDLKKVADDEAVKSVLIMCDGEGALGDADAKKRQQAVENHYRWIEWAKFLGCHSIRVNAQSAGSPDEQRRLAADGLRRLTEFGARHELNVIVENHGGISSNGAWLASVMKAVDHPRCGTLPDFGNFQTAPGEWYDRYRGVTELMPFAKAVSAKSHDFDAAGNERQTDYARMLRIVLDAGYRGYVGIEYEGDGLSEEKGIRATKALLERVRTDLARHYAP